MTTTFYEFLTREGDTGRIVRANLDATEVGDKFLLSDVGSFDETGLGVMENVTGEFSRRKKYGYSVSRNKLAITKLWSFPKWLSGITSPFFWRPRSGLVVATFDERGVDLHARYGGAIRVPLSSIKCLSHYVNPMETMSEIRVHIDSDLSSLRTPLTICRARIAWALDHMLMMSSILERGLVTMFFDLILSKAHSLFGYPVQLAD